VQQLVQLASNDSTRRFFVLKHSSLHCLVGAVCVIILPHTVPARPFDTGYLFCIKPVPTPLARSNFDGACHIFEYYYVGVPFPVYFFLFSSSLFRKRAQTLDTVGLRLAPILCASLEVYVPHFFCIIIPHKIFDSHPPHYTFFLIYLPPLLYQSEHNVFPPYFQRIPLTMATSWSSCPNCMQNRVQSPSHGPSNSTTHYAPSGTTAFVCSQCDQRAWFECCRPGCNLPDHKN
jgi:hypothetical protein